MKWNTSANLFGLIIFFLLLDEKGLTFCWIRGLFSLTGDQTQSEIARQSKTYQGGDG